MRWFTLRNRAWLTGATQLIMLSGDNLNEIETLTKRTFNWGYVITKRRSAFVSWPLYGIGNSGKFCRWSVLLSKKKRWGRLHTNIYIYIYISQMISNSMTNYHLQIFNKTDEDVNVGLLEVWLLFTASQVCSWLSLGNLACQSKVGLCT